MRRYTVHVRFGRGGVTLVPERFSWGALFLGPVWFAAVGAWLPAVLVASSWAIAGATFPPAVAVVVVLQGLLGQDLRRWSLRRRGAAMAGVVVAPDRDAALVRLLDARADLRDAWAGQAMSDGWMSARSMAARAVADRSLAEQAGAEQAGADHAGADRP